MGIRDILFAGVVLAGTGTFAAGWLWSPIARAKPPRSSAATKGEAKPEDFRGTASTIDAALRRRWDKLSIDPAPAANDLILMRRLSLALMGAVPSLEEIRRFEARPATGRVDAWLRDVLRDRRCGDYLAERLARAFVGTEDGPFLLFRRRRFKSWLSDALVANRPYDVVVRDLIADRGVWTDHPATNFVTVTYDAEVQRPDPERLGARVARAFLGVRLDCAQCHDHPFQAWKQADFRGLAAFFGGLHSDLRGVRDAEDDYRPADRKTKKPTEVEPRVPFLADLRPTTGTPREQLAAWVVDRRNPNLARATANRFWALLFGRPLAEPIDDLPAIEELPPALTILADDFSAHGYDLHRLIRVIAATEAFRRDSTSESESRRPTEERDDHWSSFPVTRLRPEQVGGAVLQASSLSTLDDQSHWLTRLIAYTGRNDFVRRYGDTGEDEFDHRGGTIPQRLLLLNGELVDKTTKSELFNASTQVAMLAPTDRKAVEVAYLTVLTRRATAEESSYFEEKLRGTGGQVRKDRLTDLYWTLLNTTEFSWNH